MSRIRGIVRLYGHRFRFWSRAIAGFYFYFDLPDLTRSQDFWKVHGGAPSTWHNRLDVQIRFAAVFDSDCADECFALILLSVIDLLVRQNELRRASVRCPSRGCRVGILRRRSFIGRRGIWNLLNSGWRWGGNRCWRAVLCNIRLSDGVIIALGLSAVRV